MNNSHTNTQQKFGFFAIIGAPNAGKSTLTNQLVGQKVTIMTHKVQTTRISIIGVVSEDECQIGIIDTPGIFDPKNRLDQAMVRAAWAGAEQAHLCALIIDASNNRGLTQGRSLLETIAKHANDLDEEQRKIDYILLNKIDRLTKEQLLPIIAQVSELSSAVIIPISARRNKGIKPLMELIKKDLPEGEWQYPEDSVTDQSLAQMACEITREKLMLRLHQELPYGLTVECEKIKVTDVKIIINQIIYVATDSHRVILIGKRGEGIKAIGQIARKELADIYERDVDLFLYVKVKPNWQDDPHHYINQNLHFEN